MRKNGAKAMRLSGYGKAIHMRPKIPTCCG